MAWSTPKTWARTDIIAEPHTELNRIEGNCKYIYDLYIVWAGIPAQTHKTDWAQTSIPTTAQAKNIDDNIRNFAAAAGLAYTTRDWGSIVKADNLLLNEWEDTLAAMKPIADLAAASLDYCGTLYTGEDGDIY